MLKTVLLERYPYLIFLLVSLFPFWINVSDVSSDAVLNLRDFDTPIDIGFDLYVRFYLWNSNWGLGLPYSAASNIPSKNLFFSFLNLFGLPLIYIEKIYLTCILFLLGCAAYYFVTNYFRLKDNYKRLCGLIGGLFYMFNIPVYTRLIGVPHILISIALYPVLFILVLKAIYSNNIKSVLRYSFCFALVSLFALSGDPSLIACYVPLILLLVFLHILIDRKKLNFKMVSFALVFILFFTLLVNLWWLTPILEGVLASGTLMEATITHPHNLEVFEATSNLVSFFDNIRLHWTKKGFNLLAPDGTPYFTPDYIKNFYNWPFSYFLFLMFLAIAIFISFKNEDNKKQIVIITLIGLIATFFSLGTHFPMFGQIHEFLFYNVPGFQVLRNFYKFQYPVLIWYVSLIVLLCDFLFCKFSRSKKNVAVILSSAIIFIFLNSLPLLAKDLAGRHEFFKVPDYYVNARTWLNKQDKDIYRILVIPQGTWEETYTWGPKFELVPIHRNFFKDSILLMQEPDNVKRLIDPIEELRIKNFNEYLKLLNVRYILIRRDIYKPNLTKKNKNLIEKLPKVLESEGIRLDQSFGKLDFYKMSDQYFLPHIYSTSVITHVYSDIDVLIPLTYTSYLAGYPALAFTDQQNKDSLQSLVGSQWSAVSSQILFVNSNFNEEVEGKKIQKEYEDLVKAKEISYLFYIDRDKIENMLKDEEKLEAVKLKGDSPFRLGTQDFYISEDVTYIIKAMVKPKRDFLESGFVSSSSSIKTSLDAISGWEIKALNAIYKQNISEGGMHIDAYFQGRGDVKESVVLTKKFSNIDIKERPYLAFSCEMEDLGVQEVEIDIRFADSNRKMTLKTSDKQYVVNLYEKTKGERLKAEGRNLLVEEVILKFKKKDGVDVSDEKKRQIYSFVFKNIAFLKHQPILAGFEDKLVAYLPDTYYYFDKNGELKNVDFLEQVPWDVKDVYRLHIQRFIDLKETPVLSLNYPKPAIENNMDGERSTFPAEWKVVMGLDFDGDEKEDEKIEMFVPTAGMSGGDLLLTVRAYEEAKKRFPDKQNYNLLSIGISHPDDKGILYQTVMSKKLIRYREHVYKPLEVRGGRLEAKGERIEAKGKRQEAKGAGVLEVDGKIYKLPLEAKGEGQKAKGEDNNWIEFNGIYLKEGEHSLNVFENDKFKVEMVEIKPISSISSIGFISSKERQEPPKIEFKKINPTRYVVDAKGANGPFTLVFSESFHEGWRAYVRKRPEVRGQRLEAEDKEKIEAQALSLRPQTSNNEHFASNLQPPASNSNEPWSALWSAWKDRGNRVEIKDHFVVNGYANGWIVQAWLKANGERQEAIGEDFEIVLEYKPQRLFEIGVLISATTLIGCIGYLGYDWCRRRKS